jgi:outer membrane protein OmpA-like peptidoglycan-associated protein
LDAPVNHAFIKSMSFTLSMISLKHRITKLKIDSARKALTKPGYATTSHPRTTLQAWIRRNAQRLPTSWMTGLTITFASTSSLANVVGVDTQNFNPTTSGLDFVTVQSSETLKPGIVNLGLFFNLAVNSLPDYDQPSGNRLKFNDTLTSMDLNAGLGFTPNWDFGISIPQVLRQSVSDQSGSRGEFAATGVTEVRLNTKYRVWGDDDGGIAGIFSTNFNQIQDSPFAGRNAGPTMNFELAGDTRRGLWSYGGNLGYRSRKKGTKIPESIVDPLGSQWIASVAASRHLPQSSTKVVTEIFAATPAESSTSFAERSLTSLEWIIGAKHDWNTNLSLHAGGGTEIKQGVASPDWRLYAGLNYAFGPIWSSESETQRSEYLTRVYGESSAEVLERFRTQAIHFEFDSDKMIGNYDPVLAELAMAIKGAFKKLVIEGHTDSVGRDEYNQRLSLRRATAIRVRLVEKFGLPADKIAAIGYGEARPIADNANYQGRQANRRVEFEIER